MSSIKKPNRRKEIKEKEELQAQFQLNISKNNNKILSWLNPGLSSTSSKTVDDFLISNNAFFDLPIIQNGSGLSSVMDLQALKVGDFINSENDLLKLSTPANSSGSLGGTNDSKAMAALKNSLRNKQRQKIEQRSQQKVPQNQQRKNFKQTLKAKPVETSTSKKHDGDDDDDDEDIAALKGRSVKKAVVQQFGKKKKGCPF